MEPSLKVRNGAGEILMERRWPAEGFVHASATGEILKAGIELLAGERVAAVGHRVVHGGMDFAAPVLVAETVLAMLVPLAPLHQPHNLAPIRAITAQAPHLPQIACFDTAFHIGQAAVVQSFGLPPRFHDMGVSTACRTSSSSPACKNSRPTSPLAGW